MTKDFSEMFHVTWEHEYFTDDNAAMFETREEAAVYISWLAATGKRRIRISGPGITDDEVDG